MRTEGMPVAPNALDFGFVDRVNQAVTDRQFNTLTANLKAEGITDFLGNARKPWTAYIELMGEVRAADGHIDPEGPPDMVTTIVQFKSARGRERFHDFFDLSLAGISGPTMPRIRYASPHELTATLGYADACTPGRFGTAYLRTEYEDLGRNLRLLVQRPYKNIQVNGIMDCLPEDHDLFKQMQAHERELLSLIHI